jgi:hypothetical protein
VSDTPHSSRTRRATLRAVAVATTVAGVGSAGASAALPTDDDDPTTVTGRADERTPGTAWRRSLDGGPVEEVVRIDGRYLALQPTEPTCKRGRSNVDTGIGIVELGACGDPLGRTTVDWQGAQYPLAFVRTDDGYVVVGTTRPVGDDEDATPTGFVVGVGGDGEVLWRVEAGDAVRDVVHDPTGGYVAVGETDPKIGAGIVLRLTPDGEVRSREEYSTRGAVSEYEFRTVVPTEDGGLVVAGRTGFSSLVLGIGPDGDVRWEQEIEQGEAYEGEVNDLVRTDDGGYALVGVGFFDPGLEGVLLKLDGDGEWQWIERYDDFRSPRAVIETESGYVLAGTSFTRALNGAVVRRTDAEGRPRWTVDREGTAAEAVVGTPDSGLVVAGSEGLPGTERLGGFALKLSADGTRPGGGDA